MSFATLARNISPSHLIGHRLASFIGVVAALPLALAAGAWQSRGAESSPPSPDASRLEATNTEVILRAFLQLQEQIQATQLAVEQSRQEAKAAAAQNAGALADGLQSIQRAFAAQRAQDWAAMQRTNKVMLIVAGAFAAIGFLTMLMMTWFQWRMSKGLAEISAALPTALGLGAGSAAAALALTNQPELRLFGAMEPTEHQAHEPGQSIGLASGRREAARMAIAKPLLSEPGALVRRRRYRAVTVAVLVGLVCAAGVAFLFYIVAYRRLGFQ